MDTVEQVALCIDPEHSWRCDGRWHKGWNGHDPYCQRCPNALATIPSTAPLLARIEALERAAAALGKIMNAHASKLLFHNEGLAEEAWNALAILNQAATDPPA